jgi:hypothetical protein
LKPTLALNFRNIEIFIFAEEIIGTKKDTAHFVDKTGEHNMLTRITNLALWLLDEGPVFGFF